MNKKMKKCLKCGNSFPITVYIEGKRKSLNKRCYCLDCSPYNIVFLLLLAFVWIPVDHPIHNCDLMVFINRTPLPEILGAFLATALERLIDSDSGVS